MANEAITEKLSEIREKLSSWGGILQHLSNNDFGFYRTQRIQKSAQTKKIRLLTVSSANQIFTSDVYTESPFRQKWCLLFSAELLDFTYWYCQKLRLYSI